MHQSGEAVFVVCFRTNGRICGRSYRCVGLRQSERAELLKLLGD